jgi:hypothetical protein
VADTWSLSIFEKLLVVGSTGGKRTAVSEVATTSGGRRELLLADLVAMRRGRAADGCSVERTGLPDEVPTSGPGGGSTPWTFSTPLVEQADEMERRRG